MKYFTADLHFDHKRIVSFTDRKLVTTQEDHTEWLINLWNNQVEKGDITYILGDVSFATKVESIEDVLTRLNGQKIVIKGNHDRSDILKELLNRNVIQSYHDYKEIKLGSNKTLTCLMHFPIASWNRQHYGSFMLCGHSHGNYQGQGKILDVGIDNSYNVFGEHQLFSEQDIEFIMKYKEISIADHHRNYKEI